MAGVLVLNADLGPLHRVTLKHALRMLWRRVAEVHEAVPGRHIGVYAMPAAVRLIGYVVPRWRHNRGPVWSKRGVLERDGRRCAYCAGPGRTIDHIVPRSRGGQNTWVNTVAACGPCNQRKGDRTPGEAGMRLRVTPATPSWSTLSTTR